MCKCGGGCAALSELLGVLELGCRFFEVGEGEDARRSANGIMWRCVEAFVLSE